MTRTVDLNYPSEKIIHLCQSRHKNHQTIHCRYIIIIIDSQFMRQCLVVLRYHLCFHAIYILFLYLINFSITDRQSNAIIEGAKKQVRGIIYYFANFCGMQSFLLFRFPEIIGLVLSFPTQCVANKKVHKSDHYVTVIYESQISLIMTFGFK